MSMLTIKHVEKNGHETITMAEGVSFYPEGEQGDPHIGPKLRAFGCVARDGGAFVDGCCCYGNGKVYVMNDAGATVGSYNLG